MPITDVLPHEVPAAMDPPCAAGNLVMHAGYDRPLAKSEFFIAVSAVYKMIGTLDDFAFISLGDKEFVGIDRIVSDTFSFPQILKLPNPGSFSFASSIQRFPAVCHIGIIV